MARLNEVPVAPESLETLKRKIFRQNRDLARSNNVRALRIKELENNCACMLSENLELRARILELERQLENNETRRIADHALAIKAKLEAQLEEWGGLIAGLGLEPPAKRQSPETKRSMVRRRRTSFLACRPSPSQRRLRDVAKDIEELGHISENKPGPRRSMNPEQILALRSEADISIDSMELGPPPISHYLEWEPANVDLPDDAVGESIREQGPEEPLEECVPESPMPLPSPHAATQDDGNRPMSAKADEQPIPPSEEAKSTYDTADSIVDQLPRAGSKRKLAVEDGADDTRVKRLTNGSANGRQLVEKNPARQKLAVKASKGVLAPKMDTSEREGSTPNERRPLASKSTNDDVMSFANTKKSSKTTKALAKDEAPMGKKQIPKSTPAKSKAKNTTAIEPAAFAVPAEEALATAPAICDLTMPITEPVLLAPNTPEQATAAEAPRGDTPPPADISLGGETLRPSRRNRAAISYAEPNLRDKMRRPTKALLDAVAGEGKYSRRMSQSEPNFADSTKTQGKTETPVTSSIPIPDAPIIPSLIEDLPGSPRAENDILIENLPASVVTERRRRPTNVMPIPARAEEDAVVEDADNTRETVGSDQSEMKETDVYEFTSSPPRGERTTIKEAKRGNRRQTTSMRRPSTTGEDDEKGRSNNRRRSMMV